MCATCGCSDDGEVEDVHGHEAGAGHPHVHGSSGHEHGEDGDHVHVHAAGGAHAHGAPWAPAGGARSIRLEQEVLGKNDRLAAENRAWLAARHVTAVNLVSSPGAGKTTLLERTLRDLAGEVPLVVIEGDQETALDADRIRAAGAPVVQLNTGRGCHLDAAMVARALRALDPPEGALLLVENVGNLVCPALFDLGERAKVVVASTPEGEDKPLKYPHMFRASALVLLNKIDLAPHLGFDAARCAAHARRVHPGIEVLPLSARRGDGLTAWYGWLRALRSA